jgi:hypothetical protein
MISAGFNRLKNVPEATDARQKQVESAVYA